MRNTPKKWIAVLLGIVAPPVAMMYVAHFRWAVVYLLGALALGLAGKFYLHDSSIAIALQVALGVVSVIHAFRLAKRYPEERPRPGYSRWYGLVGAGAGAFLVLFCVRAFIAEPFRFPSASMLPAVPAGAHLVVQKWGFGNYGTYGIHLLRSTMTAPVGRGDIVVFEFPQNRALHFAQRLIGLPGDKVDYRGKKLSINGQPIAQRAVGEYVDAKSLASLQELVESLMGVEYAVLVDKDRQANASGALKLSSNGECTTDFDGLVCIVPPGHYFTLGDNRDNSIDSRFWGFVPADHIVGKVRYIVP